MSDTRTPKELKWRPSVHSDVPQPAGKMCADWYTGDLPGAEDLLYALAHTLGQVHALERKAAHFDALREALRLLEHEMVESGNAGSEDYGWKEAITKTRAALAAADEIGGD